jgi:hypothetical protein
VLEPRRDPRLGDEQLSKLGVRHEATQHPLDRDPAREALGSDRSGDEDLGHSAAAEVSLDGVFGGDPVQSAGSYVRAEPGTNRIPRRSRRGEGVLRSVDTTEGSMLF